MFPGKSFRDPLFSARGGVNFHSALLHDKFYERMDIGRVIYQKNSNAFQAGHRTFVTNIAGNSKGEHTVATSERPLRQKKGSIGHKNRVKSYSRERPLNTISSKIRLLLGALAIIVSPGFAGGPEVSGERTQAFIRFAPHIRAVETVGPAIWADLEWGQNKNEATLVFSPGESLSIFASELRQAAVHHEKPLCEVDRI